MNVKDLFTPGINGNASVNTGIGGTIVAYDTIIDVSWASQNCVQLNTTGE